MEGGFGCTIRRLILDCVPGDGTRGGLDAVDGLGGVGEVLVGLHCRMLKRFNFFPLSHVTRDLF